MLNLIRMLGALFPHLDEQRCTVNLSGSGRKDEQKGGVCLVSVRQLCVESHFGVMAKQSMVAKRICMQRRWLFSSLTSEPRSHKSIEGSVLAQ